MDRNEWFIVFAVVLITFCSAIVGGVLAVSKTQREAVKAGVAYWTVDEKGIPEFHWITD
jgi:ribosomal protein L2